VVVALFAFILGLVGVLAYLRPSYNWDLLGYVGVVESIETRDPVEVHRLTYATVQAALPVEKYRDLVGESGDDYLNSDGYRQAVAADPEAFRQQLPFYAVKPLYPALMYAMGKMGFELVGASVLLAIGGYIGAMLVVLVWFSRHYPPLPALVFASLVAFYVAVSALARLSTPDSLGVFIVVLGAFSLIELRRARLALALFALAVLDRPNTIVLLLPLIAYLAIWAPPGIAISKLSAIVAGVLSVAMFVALSKVSGMYPFETLFYASLVEHQPYPALFRSPLGLRDYLALYVIAFSQFEFVFVLIGLVAIRLRLAWVQLGGDVMTHVSLLVLLSMALQWVASPWEVLRLMAPQFVLLIIFLVVSANPGVGLLKGGGDPAPAGS
jgi:hypothetical protein